MHLNLNKIVKIFFLTIFFILFKDIKSSTGNTDYKAILDFLLLPDIQMNTLLQKYVYDNSNKASCRDLLTLPILLYNNITYPYKTNININFFYSGILTGVYFNECQKGINSIVDTGDLSKRVNDIFEKFFSSTPYAASNFPLIGDLFENVIINQQRLGFAIDGAWANDCFAIYAQVPFLYQINYISTDSQTQNRLSDELNALIDSNPKMPNNPTAPQDFIKQHLVADFFGIDRSLVGLIIKNISNKPINIELRFFIPTGAEFKSGLIGGNYLNTPIEKTSFSLIPFVEDFFNPNNKKEYNPVSGKSSFENLFELMLDRITDAGFNMPFSNKPFAISPSFIADFDLGKGFIVSYYGTYIYEFSKSIYKYGYYKVDLKEFDLPYNTMNNKEAYETLLFFDEQFKERVLLKPFYAIVTPGWQVQSNIAIITKCKDVSTRLGVDFWYQSSESIKISEENNKNLNIKKLYFTNKDSSTQIKIFGSIDLLRNYLEIPWSFMFKAEIPVYTYSFGKEFGLSIVIETVF
jgi:hypothetical protein